MVHGPVPTGRVSKPISSSRLQPYFTNPARTRSHSRQARRHVRDGIVQAPTNSIARAVEAVERLSNLSKNEPVRRDLPTKEKEQSFHSSYPPDPTYSFPHLEFQGPDRRKKPPSIFYHERTEALDPSLVQPTPLIKQENNILFVQDIGKEYQLAVKDFNIRVRDNRIVAKDREILELNERVELKDAQLSDTRTENRRLEDLFLWKAQQNWTRQHQINEMQSSIEGLNSTKREQAQKIHEQDHKLRILRNELEFAKNEIENLKDLRLIDQILRWVQSMLGASPIPIEKSTQHFPLLHLPGELRNHIYKHCLVSPRPIDLWPIMPLNAPPGTTHSTILDLDIKCVNTSLLRVSRQVHKEATSILYGCNRFRFSDRHGWTILSGFLTHIDRNCQVLRHVSVGYPEWCSNDYGEDLQGNTTHRGNRPDAGTLEEMRITLLRFGNTILDSPSGPTHESYTACRRAGDTLIRLPNLRSFNIIVPHSIHLYSFALDSLSKILTTDDKYLIPYIGWIPPAKPKRSFVFIRREEGMRKNVFASKDVDDDVAMGRLQLAVLCQQTGSGPRVMGARYGKWEEGAGYVVDGGEEAWSGEVPGNREESVSFGLRLKRLAQSMKERLGY